MTPFSIVVVLLVVGGAGGLAWVVLPAFRKVVPEQEPEPERDPFEADLHDRLLQIRALLAEERDLPETWHGTAPLLPGGRMGAPFRPAESFFAVVEEEQAFLLPLVNVLLEATEPTDAPVVRGRSLGRAFHAVQIEGALYLDLVAAVKLIPIVAAELGTQTSLTTLTRFADLDALLQTTGLNNDQVVLLAPWLVDDYDQRLMPDGHGARSFELQIGADTLKVEAWMPSVQEGVRNAKPVWAGRASFLGHEESCLLTKAAVQGMNGERGSETWQWTQSELLELAGIGNRLQEEGVDVLPLVRDAFADKRIPKADADDDQGTLVAAAVLNWAGVVVRRSGFPREALGFFDAGLSVCGDNHEDNRADLHYNRGYARLHAASTGLASTEHEHLQSFEFDDVSSEILESALADFTIASGLNPTDADAWSQIALVNQLQGDTRAASEAWLQAATRSRDEAVKQTLLANAKALGDL